MRGARAHRVPRAALLATLLLLAAPAGGVSYQGERDLGLRFDLAARQKVPLINDPEVVAYVSGIGKKIAAALDDSYFDYQFAVVRDGRINAFAVPGGYVYVHSGLIAQARNDDEIAAVLGHEIAHVHGHHIVRQQEQTQLLNYASLVGMLISVVQPAIGSLATAASAAATLHYRREFEQEADYNGSRYMKAAGYDPRAMLDFFKTLADLNRVAPESAPPYLQSHPLTDERLSHLEAVLKTQQWSKRDRAPASFALRRVQALVRVRTERVNDVVTAYRQVLDANPNDPSAQYLYGFVCLETGQLDAAGEALAAARAGGVDVADRELGRLALRQREPEKARTLLTAFLARQPDDAGAHVELATALEVLGDRTQARAEYQRALALAPQLDTAHHGYGILAGRAGEPGDGFYHLATAARIDGDYATALSQYARAQPQLPSGDPRADETRQWIAVLSDYLRVPTPEVR
jgi:predicted Zn-dependent protease